MVGKEPVRSGVIDIGTHSTKLLIAEESGGNIKILEYLKNVTVLGKDTFLRERISQESINHIVTILDKYSNVLKEYAVNNPRIIATTAVREAKNKDVFIDTIKRKTGFEVEVLSVGDVVYYIDAYLYHKLKNKYPIHEKNLLIAELGAGSFDVSLMAQGFTLMNTGLPLGTMRLKQLVSSLDGTVQENYEALKESIEKELELIKRNMPPISIDDLILIDESYAQYLDNVLGVKKHDDFFFKITETDLKTLLDKTQGKSPDDIAGEYKIPLEVADRLVEYILLLNIFAGFSQNKSIHILETSLAEALLANQILDYEISQKYNRTNQLISVTNAICRKFNVDLAHGHQVSKLADILFDNLKELLGLKKTENLYLILAAYLHDIGMFIYNRLHHKHSEYVINSLNFFRLNDEETKVIACVARYHRRGTPSEMHLLYQSLPSDKRILVQKLSAILRVANALDRSHKQKIKELEIKIIRTKEITLLITTDNNILLEKHEFNEKKESLEELLGCKLTLKTKSV
ncbi:MAG: HD domain-containing protein [Candidatus Omnitrophica bacterium]|nr:HD domain-containing protein [Candidatus Omnitrophota bacterium]